MAMPMSHVCLHGCICEGVSVKGHTMKPLKQHMKKMGYPLQLLSIIH